MKMWKLNVENFINSHSSKLGFWGSLFGLKGKKIQVEKNWHGETYSMSVFGNGKNIKFLVQSFTPAPPHHLPTWPGGGAVGGPPGRGLSRRQPRRLPRQLHRRRRREFSSENCMSHTFRHAVQCSAVQCSAERCSAERCTAVHCIETPQ